MRDLDTEIELIKKLLVINDLDVGNAVAALGVSSPTNPSRLGPGLQRLCLLSTMYGSALAFSGVEISLGCQEPALSLADLILTAVLLDMKPMHETEGPV